MPPYLRRTKSIEELLPRLYLKGISTDDSNEALQSLFGIDCPNLSANVIVRPKDTWVCFVGNANFVEALVLSDREQNHVVQPGATIYGVNLDVVVILGNGEPGSKSFDDIIVFECSGALITDRHVLTAAHCLDKDRNGGIDFAVRSFEFVAGFQLADGEQLTQVNTNALHFPACWPGAASNIGGVDLGGDDIAVFELLDITPLEIPRYRLYGGRGKLGAAVALTGYGVTAFGDIGVGEFITVAPVKRAGLNRLEAFCSEREVELGFDLDSGQPQHNALPHLGYDSDLGFGAHQVLTAFGDSGAPVLGATRLSVWPPSTRA